MKIKIAITSLIALVFAVASPFEAVAFEKITNYEKIYSDSFSVSSTNMTWTKQGNTSIWIGTGNIQQSWTPQITFNKNITVEKGDLVVLNYTTWLKQSIPDECSVGLSYWAVVDCYNEYESGSSISDPAKLDMLGCNHKIQNPDGTWMCDEWKAIYNSIQNDNIGLMKNKFYYTLRWQSETTTINNIRLGGVLFSRDAVENLPVIWSVGTVSFFRGGKGLTDIYNYLEENDVNQGQQEAGEQAQQEAQQTSDTAQTTAEQGSASLLQGATSIIGALTDTQAGNCTINLNMGTLNMGTQDFCQGDIGPIRPIIATITNVLFAFVAFKVFAFLIGVMFGLFDEFFGTRTEKG